MPQSGPCCSQSSLQVLGDLKRSNSNFCTMTGRCCWMTWRRARGQELNPRSSTPRQCPCCSSSSIQGLLNRCPYLLEEYSLEQKIIQNIYVGAVGQECWGSVQSRRLLWGILASLPFVEILCISGDRSETDLWEELDEEGDHLQHAGDAGAGRHVQGTWSTRGHQVRISNNPQNSALWQTLVFMLN